jgi:DEAD/DEAH box helicase domain-containing protein
MRVITFDIETEGDFRGNGDMSGLEVTVVGIHDSETGKLQGFFKEDLSKLWPIFESADAIVGYNSDHFDIPILNRYYTGDLTKLKSIDLLKEVKNVLGRRLKLDNIAEATLGKKKSGNGLEAVSWWKQGLKDKVMAYCLDDVKITADLYNYAKKKGHVKYRDYDGVREIKLDTSTWEEMPGMGITHTLPF